MGASKLTMMQRLIFKVWGALLLMLLSTPSTFASAADTAPAPRFSITELGVNFQPKAINNSGQIVGTGPLRWQDGKLSDLGGIEGSICVARSINGNGNAVGDCAARGQDRHAILWSNGQTIDLGSLNSSWAFVTGINDGGEIVGNIWSEKYEEPRAFECTKDGLATRRLLGQPIEAAVAINNRGDVAGKYGAVANETKEGNRDAVLWNEGKTTDLGDFAPTALNDKREVVGNRNFAPFFPGGSMEGSYGMAVAAHAVIWIDGKVTPLATPGFEYSYAAGINGVGDVVGCGFLKDLSPSAVMWCGGRCYDLNTCIDTSTGWHIYDATAINDAGQIVGTASHGKEEVVGVLLSPSGPPNAVEQSPGPTDRRSSGLPARRRPLRP